MSVCVCGGGEEGYESKKGEKNTEKIGRERNIENKEDFFSFHFPPDCRV